MESNDTKSQFTGLLNVEVKAPPVIAGKNVTVNLLIRNPFPEPICIESIQAPTSSFLAKHSHESRGNESVTKRMKTPEPTEAKTGEDIPIKRSDTKAGRLLSMLDKLTVKEVKLGPLVAHFPEQASRNINIVTKPNCTLDVQGPLAPTDSLNIKADEGSHININLKDIQMATSYQTGEELRIIASHQEDIASFELLTANWLMVKPTTLELYALIKYRIGDESRSQVIPVSLSIQPPVTSIVLGSTFGGLLGFAARQINSGILNHNTSFLGLVIGVAGVVVMSAIAAIVLSRRETAKGFITLEDFYGAFVVGALIGYLGTEYFGNILGGAAKPGT